MTWQVIWSEKSLAQLEKIDKKMHKKSMIWFWDLVFQSDMNQN